MKAYLMFRDRTFDIEAAQCFGRNTLATDLELKRVLTKMARGDTTIHAACDSALFRPLQSTDEISYRQEVLRDTFRNPTTVRRLYAITVETARQRKAYWHKLSSIYLSNTFSNAIGLLTIYTDMLMKLRSVADKELANFQSAGFRNLLLMLQKELSDDYLAEVRAHLRDLKDNKGILISANLGNYLHGVNYVLRRKNYNNFWRRWFLSPSFSIDPSERSETEDLVNRRDRAINEATNALAIAADNLAGFFVMLQNELAFYVGCLNLSEDLQALKLPICFPDLRLPNSTDRSWQGLYDISLALLKNKAVVGNELKTADKDLYIVTGANQGGKTTFLRSLGQAQLMAQSGMFVGGSNFSAPLCRSVFSHFTQEEDPTMRSGKLEEELARMSELVDYLKPGALLLLNESFASTNEREGSEICRQITQALLENGVEVFTVTHLYTYALAFLTNERVQYLRAERLEDGKRTFKITPGEPLPMAFGEDLYREIFGQ